MSADSSRAVVRRLFEEVVARQRLDLIQTLVADDILDHNARSRGWGQGREGVANHVKFLKQVFPDFELTVDHIVAADEWVVVFWHFVGTHRDALWGIPATGRRVRAQTVSVVKVVDGQVVEYEARPDRLNLLLQLGSLGEYAPQLAASASGPPT